MPKKRIRLTIRDLERLNKWVAHLDPQPFWFELEQSEPTGLGSVVTAYVETSEDEGRWKEITDVREW